ncbi:MULTISPECIES: OPT family oligopeptide transporter [Vitreoscilla]|uniref:Oligopeptide transporter, OPT family n=1 Tax=Vitreoscilla stercoraria TaxID=61 RepID=A0ABY4E8Y0_VITST|nr:MULTISPECIES: oligopeptide transporter, OPT family [Vitreoscilla]QJQ52172.1 OPT oligopeptide transporter protein [Vitreoscilla sp. C1]UOO91729.1 oligopeptide transporter, OPT family [Vitreoscilla stercoraria]
MNQPQRVDHFANYRELTIRGIILGALITVIFTASNVYLGLKVGLTFASAIPAAVISMAVLKFAKDSNILENNMVQTQASAAGTLSSIIFVLPGLLMLGYWQNFPFWQTTMICLAGGILGVIFTIPLRHVMVVNSNLPYPEGVAAAEILKAGTSGLVVNEKGEIEQDANSKPEESGIKEIVMGGALAGVFSFMVNGLRIASDHASHWFKMGNAIFQLPMGFSVALLAAGYLVGIAGGMAILTGIAIAWGVAVPVLSSTAPMPADADMVSYAMTLWKEKVRFIGAGTIGIAAIWTLLSLAKPMMEGMRMSFEAIKNPAAAANTHRADRDLSPKAMIGISLLMVLILFITFYSFVQAAPISAGLGWGLVAVATLLAVVIGFLVAAACGYMAGLIGSSSSPISGIGIVSVLLIATTFLIVGESTDLLSTTEGSNFLTALTLFVASAVMAVATISNDNLQDLKTGYLVHATPAMQQIALIIGCVVGAVVISPILDLLFQAYGFTGAMPREGMDAAQALSAPQATLMTTISKGIFAHNLQWDFILMGVGIGIAVIIVDALLKKSSGGRLTLPALAIGMGIYLPPSINMPLIIGTVMSYLLHRHLKKTRGEAAFVKGERRGTLFAAGLIVGESLIGVAMAMIIVVSVTSGGSDAPMALQLANWDTMATVLGLAGFLAALALFVQRVLRK